MGAIIKAGAKIVGKGALTGGGVWLAEKLFGGK
ncbi:MULTISPECIES: GatB family leaderless bacteriocin [Lactococcus]|uniref:Garvicin KS peptide C n=1 Tax=Lactococcus garvieae TaxID=1363 RepID=A0A1B0Z2N8_9LACT|nr:GatB family leaderless bacteriocin [Lactococcus lactis]ANO58550.1 garvicin KS peptide C [Lactococcus garvieae]